MTTFRPPTRPSVGVEIVATGSYLPEDRITNADLERLMDTSDEWITQRTGIRERRRADAAGGESVRVLATNAIKNALAIARIDPLELDLVILATVSMEMTCPSTSCRIAATIGATRAGAFDLTAACSGFVYGTNLAHELIRGGSYKSIAVIGAETLTDFVVYDTSGRGTAILFGDGAGAVILRATNDTSKGIIAQALHADGTGWCDLFIPRRQRDFPDDYADDGLGLNILRMNGRGVFKFAVKTFSDLIQETLDKAGMTPEQVDHYFCHQSNIRIIEAARERFGLPAHKVHVNIERVGNTSAASIPILFDETKAAGKVKPGDVAMFVAFGGGLTWASSLWQL